MFSNLKFKIQNVQQDITHSLKALTSRDGAQKQYRPSGLKTCNFEAGFEVLLYYQIIWKTHHEVTESNAQAATKVDDTIAEIREDIDAKLDQAKQLNYQICVLPQLTAGIQNLMIKIGEIEGLFEDVHSALTNLENLIDEEKMNEQKLAENCRLSLYKEKKLVEFEAYKSSQECRQEEKMRERMIKNEALMKERQEIFKEAFEEEMQNYKTRGQLNRSVSSGSNKPSLDLNDVVLDEDTTLLDDFLADTADEPDVSADAEAATSSDEPDMMYQVPATIN